MKEHSDPDLPRRGTDQPPRVEVPVRNTMLIGFFILLLLIAAMGYWSMRSFTNLGREIAVIHERESGHLRLVMKISEVLGKMTTEARAVLANRENTLLRFPAEQNLEQRKDEMDTLISTGRKTALADRPEWRRFELEFSEYWKSLHEADSDWAGEREDLILAILNLEQAVTTERERAHREWEQSNNMARRGLTVATGAAMLLGAIVAGLSFYEIRRILDQLGAAYRQTSESRDYLRSLLDSLVSGVVVVGQDGAIRTISDSFPKLTDWGSGSSIGEDYRSFFSEKPLLINAISADLSEETTANRYYGRVEFKQGRLFDVFASPLVIGAQQQGLILVFVDITENERAQNELRRNRALTAIGQMTAQIAHEIKNPLGSIRFATEILKRDSSPPAQQNEETVQVIERSVDHLAAIVNELSEFVRPKDLARSDLNINELLDDLLPMVADRLAGKSVSVEKLYGEIPSGAYDGTELKKMFLNLIINAIDASDPGAAIKLQTRRDDSREILVEIIDRGSGMDPETLRRLFEPFYTTKKAGTGLGMSIAKKIAEAHRGDLIIDSRKGVGTKVTVRLPLE